MFKYRYLLLFANLFSTLINAQQPTTNITSLNHSFQML